ncbi:hypothetical protein D1164_17900 [Mariniphaga sediminis]|uniref:Glycoside hydrolase family 127 protein n=1 Tax=Mariniphaga sediminis TaxID=1628158 RepID=A0A399CWD2_9BACT|nr:beta-L-arabinofuranosidase domain-containing protein [Mariniphaga sediminis]RIH63809.1 hypothetical protein D1164_17900 [Mariniphaga sediminis]
MKNLFITWLFVLFIGTAFAQGQKQNQPDSNNAIVDLLQPATASQIRGFLGEKLDASYYNRILAQDVERLISPFWNRTETSCWQSEFWGKWLTSAVLAYCYHPEPQLKDILDMAVEGLIATQSANGYIGNYADDWHLKNWDIWGRKYCLLGLLAYYNLRKDGTVLQAACNLADHLIKELADNKVLIVKQGNHRGMAASSILEPICLLFSRTKEKRYLEFAKEIVRQWEITDGPQLITKANVDVSKRFPKTTNWYGWEQGQKAYEMMSCYEGLLEFYRLTGKDEYKEAVEKTWENIRSTEINIVGSGASIECWFGGKELQSQPILHYQETCVTVTWIKLCQKLLRLTGEAKYADAIEQAYYNALLGSMKPDGAEWAMYSPLSGQRMVGSEQCGMGINCCKANGPRSLFSFPSTVAMGRNDGLQVNFYAKGAYVLQTPDGQKVKLVQETDYPISGKINIKIELPKSEEMAIRLRIPEWSKHSSLFVNEKSVPGITAGQYVVIQKKWKDKDKISLYLDMKGKIIKPGKQTENIAIVRGPIVFARDSRLLGSPLDAWLIPLTDKDGYLNLKMNEQKPQGFWMQCKVQCKYEPTQKGGDQQGQLTFCDYASAGNTFDERSRFRVWFPQLIDPRK